MTKKQNNLTSSYDSYTCEANFCIHSLAMLHRQIITTQNNTTIARKVKHGNTNLMSKTYAETKQTKQKTIKNLSTYQKQLNTNTDSIKNLSKTYRQTTKILFKT